MATTFNVSSGGFHVAQLIAIVQQFYHEGLHQVTDDEMLCYCSLLCCVKCANSLLTKTCVHVITAFK